MVPTNSNRWAPTQSKSKRRVHGAEFKTQVLAECQQPGASVAAVALAHGLNVNLLSGVGVIRPPGVGIYRPRVVAPKSISNYVVDGFILPR